MPTKIKLDFYDQLRDDQKPIWHYLESGGLRAVCVAHRRYGKDCVALHWTCIAAMQRIGNYWHCLPEYAQARKAVWDAVNPASGKLVIDECFPKELRTRTSESEMKIDFLNGSSWQMVGSDTYNQCVGSVPIGVTFSEWALANPMAWSLGIRPILEQNGGWALWIYTPRGDNHGKTLYEFAKQEPGWFATLISADQTPVFSPAQLTRIRREMAAEIGDEAEAKAIFDQEYMCSFSGAIRGAYYAKQMAAAEADGRICSVGHQPGQEVYTYWDLGVDDSTSIWFIQHIGQAHHVIDYYQNSGMGMDHYATLMKSKNYNYAAHVMPHDGDARQMTGGELAKSPKELAEDSGIKPVEIVERARNMEIIVKSHIPAVRNILSQCWFDKTKCAAGISALKSYHAEYNEEKKVSGVRPQHDWSSHASDGFRTFAVGYAPPKKQTNKNRVYELIDRR